MMKRLSVLGVTVLVSSLAACAATRPTPASSPGRLMIEQNSATAFDATYRRGEAWARARVAYSPTSTFYEITTSTGTVVVRTGTALDATRDAPPPDPRRQDEVVRLAAADPEYPLVAGLLDGLLAAGASPTPTGAETGSTLYAAAYFAAKALGRTPPCARPRAGSGPTPATTTWRRCPPSSSPRSADSRTAPEPTPAAARTRASTATGTPPSAATTGARRATCATRTTGGTAAPRCTAPAAAATAARTPTARASAARATTAATTARAHRAAGSPRRPTTARRRTTTTTGTSTSAARAASTAAAPTTTAGRAAAGGTASAP